MTLPAQVAAAAASADQIQEQLANPQSAQTVTETQPQETAAVQTPPVVDETEKLRSRYSSLRGKYDAEVPRLNQAVKSMEAKVQELEAENKRLQEAAESAKAKAGLTDNDREVYGDDMLDMIRRGGEETMAPFAKRLAQLESENKELKARVDATQQASNADRDRDFVRQLDAAIPNWREQNSDDDFIDWLQEPIPSFGIPRQAALKQAEEMRDAATIAGIFKEYQQEKAAKKANGLGRQVQPDYARKSAAPAGTTPNVWTQAKVADFYERVRRHEFTPEQIQQLEKEMNDALMRNRGQLPPY